MICADLSSNHTLLPFLPTSISTCNINQRPRSCSHLTDSTLRQHLSNGHNFASSTMGIHPSVTSDIRRVAKKQARDAKACNVQHSQQDEKKMHERTHDEKMRIELALCLQRRELYKVALKYLNYSKQDYR